MRRVYHDLLQDVKLGARHVHAAGLPSAVVRHAARDDGGSPPDCSAMPKLLVEPRHPEQRRRRRPSSLASWPRPARCRSSGSVPSADGTRLPGNGTRTRPGPGMRRGSNEEWDQFTSRDWPGPGGPGHGGAAGGRAALAVAVLAALTLVSGAQHAAYGCHRKPRTAGPRRRCPAPCRRRTTTPAGRASPTTSPPSTAPPTATAPTGSTWRPPPTPRTTPAAAPTTWAGPTAGQWFKYTVNVATAGTYTRRLPAGLAVRDHRRAAHRQLRRHQPVRRGHRPEHRRLRRPGPRSPRASPCRPGSRR